MNEITIDRNVEWSKSVDLMSGLFPKWVVTQDQIDAWKQQFGMLNPVWFREALQLIYTKYSSDSPKPRWVVEAFREVKAGHTGVPITEYGIADQTICADRERWQAEDAEATASRERLWNEVCGWSNEERVDWAKSFKKRYGFLDERNDPAEMDTWSRTFCGFVVVYRRGMEREGNDC